MTIGIAVDDGREPERSNVAAPAQRALVISDVDAGLIAELGRLEDVAFSPSGRRVAVAGFIADRIVVADLETSVGRSAGLTVRRIRVLTSPGITRPHGLDFLDEHRLVVANRTGTVCAVNIPRDDGPLVSEVAAQVIADADSDVPVVSPGSVTARRSASGHLDIVVCDNDGHTVNRYVVDHDDPSLVVHASVIAAAELKIPDGVAIDPSGRWMAISNHELHQVWMYRYDGDMSPDRLPDGFLDGVNFPHGLSFAGGGSVLMVADAGLPYTAVFHADDGDWSGERDPVRVTRVMDDAQFRRERVNLTEGGMKGIAINGDVVAFVGNHGGMDTFGADDILGADLADIALVPGSADDGSDPVARQLVEHAYRSVERIESDLVAAEGECDRLRARLDENDGHLQSRFARIADLEKELEAVRQDVADMRASHSWRITAPLRKITERARRRS